MSISFWIPVDFFLGFSGSRHRLLEVPVITEERMSRDYKVVEISWSLMVSTTLIVDLKRVRPGFSPAKVLKLRTNRFDDSCQLNTKERTVGERAA